MAQSVGLSIGHFSRVFQKSMGESPHQFVLRNRIGRAKEMLRVAEVRVLDVAVACGFKTQQHFARVSVASMGRALQNIGKNFNVRNDLIFLTRRLSFGGQ